MNSEAKEKWYQDLALEIFKDIDQKLRPHNIEDKDTLYILGIVTASVFTRFIRTITRGSKRPFGELQLMTLVAGHSATIAGYVESLLKEAAAQDRS